MLFRSFLFLVAVFVSSCGIFKPVILTSEVTETSDTTKADVEIKVHGGKIVDIIDLPFRTDTLYGKDTIYSKDTVTIVNDSLGIELRRWRNRANQLITECVKRDATYRTQIDKITKTRNEVRYETKYVDKIVEVNKWGFWEWAMFVTMCALFVACICFVLVIMLRR